uniref:Uncharacterized protein n=1 Tax=Romanomermis culicivorax TaxID=13658 RepID=A0A915I9T1_ROMCU
MALQITDGKKSTIYKTQMKKERVEKIDKCKIHDMGFIVFLKLSNAQGPWWMPGDYPQIFMPYRRIRNPPFSCLKGGYVLQIADILFEIFKCVVEAGNFFGEHVE